MERKPAQDDPRDELPGSGDAPKEEQQVQRGEQGTSSGDPHDDFDPQQG